MFGEHHPENLHILWNNMKRTNVVSGIIRKGIENKLVGSIGQNLQGYTCALRIVSLNFSFSNYS